MSNDNMDYNNDDSHYEEENYVNPFNEEPV